MLALTIGSGRVAELAQLSEAQENEIDLPEGTLVFSQTARIAARVYHSDGVTRLNLYNKQTGMTEVRGAPVMVESKDTGITSA